MRTLLLLGAMSLALGLAGCGGGDGGGAAAPPPGQAGVPASAMASVPAFTQFVGSLRTSERAEPLLLRDDAVPPVNDTDEPMPAS